MRNHGNLWSLKGLPALSAVQNNGLPVWPSQPISSLMDDDITGGLFSLVGANMSLLCLRPAETPSRGTKAAPRRPGPEPRPVSPDWAAAARRTPDPSRRAATFDPGTAQTLRTFRGGCGDLFKLVAHWPTQTSRTGSGAQTGSGAVRTVLPRIKPVLGLFTHFCS